MLWKDIPPWFKGSLLLMLVAYIPLVTKGPSPWVVILPIPAFVLGSIIGLTYNRQYKKQGYSKAMLTGGFISLLVPIILYVLASNASDGLGGLVIVAIATLLIVPTFITGALIGFFTYRFFLTDYTLARKIILSILASVGVILGFILVSISLIWAMYLHI